VPAVPPPHQLISAPLGRRRFLQLSGYGVAGLAVSQFLAACGGSDSDSSAAGGTTAMSLQLSWLKDVEFGPLFAADDAGYFTAEDIDLDLVAGGPDIGAIEGIVAGGSTQFGIATDITSVIAAAADGNPLVCVGTLYQENLNVLMSPPDAPITSVADMVGKRLGGVQGVQTKYDAMFTLAGLEPDYTFVPVGYGPDALINGDCDVQGAFITDEVLAYEAATGKKPTILTYTDAGLPAYTLVLFTTRDYLADNRDAVKGLLRAIRKGYDDFAADPDAVAELTATTYGADAGLTAEDEKRKAGAYLPLATGPTTEADGYLYMDVDYVSGDIYRGMEAAGLGTAPVEDVVDMSLLDELNQE
jgi:NitT/TauT family transport system substrate-binding protein